MPEAHPSHVRKATALGNPLHFVLRVSDSLMRVDTFEAHAAILAKRRSVWIGKWGARVGTWPVDVANAQVANKVPTYLYLRFGNEMRYRAKVKAVAPGGLAPDRTMVPEYYRDDRCAIWFQITSLEDCRGADLTGLRKFLEPDARPSFASQVGIHFVTLVSD